MNKLFSSHEHVLQGGYFQDTLRKLQAPNTSIEPHNIMYPVFLLLVFRCHYIIFTLVLYAIHRRIRKAIFWGTFFTVIAVLSYL